MPPSPLPCTGRASCVAAERRSDADADALFRAAREAVVALSGVVTSLDEADRRADAVFRVFFFRDDVAVHVRPDGNGARVFVRSSSRVGRWDAGVNRWRVRRLLRRIARQAGPLRAVGAAR